MVRLLSDPGVVTTSWDEEWQSEQKQLLYGGARISKALGSSVHVAVGDEDWVDEAVFPVPVAPDTGGQTSLLFEQLIMLGLSSCIQGTTYEYLLGRQQSGPHLKVGIPSSTGHKKFPLKQLYCDMSAIVPERTMRY